MGNLTVVIDDDVLLRARKRALDEGTSVNAVVREQLEAYAGEDEARVALDRVLAASRVDQPQRPWRPDVDPGRRLRPSRLP